MGEAINLIDNFNIENVIFNIGTYNELEKDLIKILKEKNIKYYKDIKELNIDSNKLYFLNTGIYDNENDNSNVIYFKLNNYKFLFMGDASEKREIDIIRKYNIENICSSEYEEEQAIGNVAKYWIKFFNIKTTTFNDMLCSVKKAVDNLIN